MTAPGSREALDRAVRLAVFRAAAETARVPAPADITAALGISPEDVEASLHRLAEERVLVLAPGPSTRIWMANPFSAVPTAHRAFIDGRTYWGNCIWDVLGIPPALHADAEIATACGDCGMEIRLRVAGGELVEGEGIVHYGVPAARWWDNIGYT